MNNTPDTETEMQQLANIETTIKTTYQNHVDGKDGEQKLYLFRIGGGAANNLKPSTFEASLSPPGISLLIGTDAQSVANQFRAQFPNRQFSIVGQIGVEGIRASGFDVIYAPTDRFINHARLTHPNGAQGFSLENRQRISGYFENIATP